MIDERAAAIAAVDAACPRCGADRERDQAYCLECGQSLPGTTGSLPALRRRWIRRLGWYPGDWIWPALGLLAVAAAGVAVAATVSHRRTAETRVVTALTPLPVTTAATASPVGQQVWPTGEIGWTVILGSFPTATGRAEADATVAQAVKDGLPQVGILDSSRSASLQPGYFVVFSGIYSSQGDANAAEPEARQAGFDTSYTRRIAG